MSFFDTTLHVRKEEVLLEKLKCESRIALKSLTSRPGTAKSAVGGQSYRQPQDEALGFDAAVAAIGMKANVCEADHPLLCEATRRQVSCDPLFSPL